MKQYLDLLKDIKENGVSKMDRTGTGTKSVFGRMIRFDLNEGFPLLTTKKIHTKSIIHEMLWFLKGDTNIKYLNDNGVTIWDEWADKNGDLGPVYGKQWTAWEKYGYRNVQNGALDCGIITEDDAYRESHINQIENLINDLKNNPDSRRLMVNAWNVADIDKMKLPPCHYGFQCYSQVMTPMERYNRFNKYAMDNSLNVTGMSTDQAMEHYNYPTRKLSLEWNQRSVDTQLGLPFNIASYAFLTHMLAQVTNHEVGELIGNLGDTHIYNNHMVYVNEQLTRTPKHLPRLKINRKIKNVNDFKFEDFEIIGYDPYPNWKNVPIAI